MGLVMKGITAKGKSRHGLVQLTAQCSFVGNDEGRGVERDQVRERHSGLSNKALEYLAKKFPLSPKRALDVFKGQRGREYNVKVRFVF